MTTLWEMAETIRAEERAKKTVAQAPRVDPSKSRHHPRDYHGMERIIDIRTRERLAYWCKSLGATPSQLYRAVAHVGQEPSAIRRFLIARLSPGRLRA